MGGGISGGPYVDFAYDVYNTVKALNDQGQYYPIWGTCMGFQDLVMFAADELDEDKVLTRHNSHSKNLDITFTTAPEGTKMFGPLGEGAYVYEDFGLTYNSHSWGVTVDFFN